jgi:hypothetical protein
MRYSFLSTSRHQKLNPQWKNLGSVALERGDLIPASCGFKELIKTGINLHFYVYFDSSFTVHCKRSTENNELY